MLFVGRTRYRFPLDDAARRKFDALAEVAEFRVLADDPDAFAGALVDVLLDRAWAERLAAGAAESAEDWLATPEEFAERIRTLVASLD